MKTLRGKTAFVTGAASGIGLGIATSLAKAGANVMLADIEEAPLQAAVAGLKDAGFAVDGVRTDVSVKADLQAAADKVVNRFGKVHILVNNAGVVGNTEYGSWSDASWSWILGVNLMGVVWGFEIFGPLIESHGEGGQIVSTASKAGLVAAGPPAYYVSKYGVVALSEGLREEFAGRGIGVSVLCPGPVKTNIMRATRNVPAQYANDSLNWSSDSMVAEFQAGIDIGVEPSFVGELVREGIEQDQPYIFCDARFNNAILHRFNQITATFERFKARHPDHKSTRASSEAFDPKVAPWLD